MHSKKWNKTFDELGINVLTTVWQDYTKNRKPTDTIREEIVRDLHACQGTSPHIGDGGLSKGIDNFYSPNDVCDASMPAMIRNGGKMWATDGKPYDCKTVMPNRPLRVFTKVINFCKWHSNFVNDHGYRTKRRFDGTKAEEYGSRQNF